MTYRVKSSFAILPVFFQHCDGRGKNIYPKKEFIQYGRKILEQKLIFTEYLQFLILQIPCNFVDFKNISILNEDSIFWPKNKVDLVTPWETFRCRVSFSVFRWKKSTLFR